MDFSSSQNGKVKLQEIVEEDGVERLPPPPCANRLRILRGRPPVKVNLEHYLLILSHSTLSIRVVNLCWTRFQLHFQSHGALDQWIGRKVYFRWLLRREMHFISSRTGSVKPVPMKTLSMAKNFSEWLADSLFDFMDVACRRLFFCNTIDPINRSWAQFFKSTSK